MHNRAPSARVPVMVHVVLVLARISVRFPLYFRHVHEKDWEMYQS